MSTENGVPVNTSTKNKSNHEEEFSEETLLSQVIPGALELLRTLQTHLSDVKKTGKDIDDDDKRKKKEEEEGDRFLTDAMYFAVYEKLYALHEYGRVFRLRLTDRLFDPVSENEVDKATNFVQPHLAKSLKNLGILLEENLGKCLEVEKMKPRIVRLADRLKLDDEELRAFIFIIFYCSGTSPGEEGGWFVGRSALQKWKDWSGFQSTAKMLSFLSPTRLHFKTGLIDAHDDYAANYSEVSFQVPRAVLKALYGARMDVEEALSFEKTPLAEVLEEEEGAIVGEYAKSEDKEDDDGDEDGESKVNEMIKNLGGKVDHAPFLEKLRFISDKQKELKVDKANGSATDDKNDGTEAEDEEDGDGDGKLVPYTNDLEYLQQGFEVVIARIRIFNLNEKEEEPYLSNKRNRDTLLRELEAKERQALSKFNRRLKLTRSRSKDSWLPRLEQLVDMLGLNEFERFVVLSVAGVVLSQKVSRAFRAIHRYPPKQYDVNMLLTMNTSSLEQQIQYRKYFYPDARLCSSGLIRTMEPISRRKHSTLNDLASIAIEIDRRMLDYVSGLDTELNDLLSCVRCYQPSEKLDRVVLPEETKKLVVQAAENFDTFKRFRREVGFDDIVRYGKGLNILLYGEPGTGKTLFANALACHLNKKILSVQFALMEQQQLDTESFRVLFREATIQDAIVFFDECESLFENRRGGRSSTSIALQEIESFDGIIIMTTNEPKALDHAMHRRISLAVEFTPPDPSLRREIWLKHVPEKLKMASDVDYTALAIEHELTGGFIKNAILQAMSMAIIEARERKKIDDGKDGNGKNEDGKSEEDDVQMGDIEITMNMLRKSCRLQARGRLRMTDLGRRVIPKRSFKDLVLPEDAMVKLKDCVMSEKVRGILASQWGFKNSKESGRANIILLHGPSGCGKTATAHAISYEVGRPVQKFSAAEVLRRDSHEIHVLFADAGVADSIIVIDDCELLFASLSNIGQSSANETLYHITSFPGLVVLCCTTAPFTSIAGWPQFLPFPELIVRTIRYIVEIPKPDKDARLKLWKLSLPEETPVADDVDKKLDKVAEDYKFSGALIASCARRAASMAALRGVQESRKSTPVDDGEGSDLGSSEKDAVVTIEDIEMACETEKDILELADKGAPSGAFV